MALSLLKKTGQNKWRWCVLWVRITPMCCVAPCSLQECWLLELVRDPTGIQGQHPGLTKQQPQKNIHTHLRWVLLFICIKYRSLTAKEGYRLFLCIHGRENKVRWWGKTFSREHCHKTWQGFFFMSRALCQSIYYITREILWFESAGSDRNKSEHCAAIIAGWGTNWNKLPLGGKLKTKGTASHDLCTAASIYSSELSITVGRGSSSSESVQK